MKTIPLLFIVILISENTISQDALPDTAQLQEVVIKGSKPLIQQTPEGIVVNAESSLMTKGSSVLQVLERSPGVQIDYRNNSISLNGKNGVMVMLDGKLMRMSIDQITSVLNGMSADNIEKIELLITPSSKYDAEGSAGVINIVLKKNKKQGSNGSFSATVGYGWREKAAASINLAHNSQKLALYGSYSFLHDRAFSHIHINSAQNMPVFGGKIVVDVWDTTTASQNNHDASVGFDYTLNRRIRFGSNINWNTSDRSSMDFNHLDFTVLPDSLLFFDGTINNTSRWNNLLTSFYIEDKIKEGEKINLSADYLYFNNHLPSTINSSFFNADGTQAGNNDSLFSPLQKGFANTIIKVGVLKFDYSKQVNNKTTVEAGLKGTLTGNTSASGIQSLVNNEWINRGETINQIIMREYIGAAYSSVNIKIDQRTNLTAGLRYEYAVTDLDDPSNKENLVTRKSGKFFPGISFTRKIKDNKEVQLSWSKRISRPTYNDLASFVRYSDPTAVYIGNPLLKPTITNSIRLGYTFKRISMSLTASKDDYPIARYQLLESEQRNLLYVTPQNLSYQKNLNLQINLPARINEWWNMTYSFTGGLRQFRLEHTKVPATKSYLGYAFNFNQSFRFSDKFSSEVSGWYNSTSYNGSVKVDGFGIVNAGIKMQMKNTGTLQLAIADLFRTMRIHAYFGAVTEEAFSIKNHVDLNAETRRRPVVKLTYSRSFGNNSALREKRNSTSEELDRLRKE